MKNALIKLENVTFAYPGSQPVLRNINLEVQPGDFLVILGSNGAAKTTLLKIMLGLLKPQYGSVHFNSQLKGQGKGYIPQKNSGINPGFPATVEEVVALNITPGSPEKKSLIQEALEKVGLWEKKEQLLGTLSGGQMQKVMIARALIAAPQLLFLDEPFTGLDAASQKDFMELISRLNQEGLTILLVTHDLQPVAQRANRFLSLYNGQLKENSKI